jgi:TRAP-type C4-dicarboxylate transport system substrate-binding protein
MFATPTRRAFTGSLALALAMGVSLAAGAAERWDLPAAYPESNYHTEGLNHFADLVREKTGGAIDIVVHANGSLFRGDEIKRAVQTGQVPIGERLISALGNENPIFELDAVPFLATDFDQAMKLYLASKPVLDEILAAQSLKMLYAVAWPPQGIYAKKELNSGADMRGVKFRAYNAATARLADLLGAVPTQIEAAEISQAFATGVAESMISSGATGYDMKLWEHTSHWYDVQAWLPKNFIIVNLQAWNALDETTRAAILEAAAEAEAWGWAKARELSDWYKDQLAENGMTIAPPGPQLKADFEVIGATMTEEWLAKTGAQGQAIVDAYRSML